MVETTSLYDGEIICEFNALRHTYTIINKGRRYKVPSVTRITSVLDKSGPLVNWAINNTLDVCKGAIGPGVEYSEIYLEQIWKAAKQSSTNIKSDAARRGTEQHRRLESELKSSIGVSSETLSDDGRRWLEQFRFQEIERRIYSRRYRYSGTFDALATTQVGLVLIDWKTSKSIYPEFRLQTAAYVHAYEEEFPDEKIEGRYLVRIAPDGSIEPHYYPRSTFRLDFSAFLGALRLFKRVQQIEAQARKEKKLKELEIISGV
jgi:PD-(D/E)XK nuclease superfamily